MLFYIECMAEEREIKLKFPEDLDFEGFLIGRGGKFIKKERQIDLYLDFDDFKLKNSGSALRLRISGNECFLTFKGPQKKDIIKNRDEYEIKVSDHTLALKIFESLGIKEKLRVVKDRSIIMFEGLKFEIDNVENLGNFVEVEIKSDEEIEKVKKIAQAAGIEWKPILKGYAELLAEK